MNLVQLALCHRRDALELPAELASEHLLGFFVPERLNLASGYYYVVFNATQQAAHLAACAGEETAAPQNAEQPA
jgi:hypothetical protein